MRPEQLLLPLILLVAFWLLLIRPAAKARRKQAELMQAVTVGDRVIISAGIFGTVVSVEDDRLGLEVAPGTVLTVAKQAVVRRLEDETPDAQSDTANPADADKTEE